MTMIHNILMIFEKNESLFLQLHSIIKQNKTRILGWLTPVGKPFVVIGVTRY